MMMERHILTVQAQQEGKEKDSSSSVVGLVCCAIWLALMSFFTKKMGNAFSSFDLVKI